MRYPLYDLNCDDFERLVVLICNHILGSATIPFAKGKDGGKDGKFIGKANKIPSESSPWNGKIIIQAKHTEKINASCSESSFNRIIENEIITSIEYLKGRSEIDFYLLFTNRSLSGIQDSAISKKINDATGIPTILIAEEKIQMYLHKQIKENDMIVVQSGFEYPGLDKKNELNNLSKNYFDDVIKKSLEDFDKIRLFLSDSINQDIEEIYADAASELNAKIALKREQFYEFEQILEMCYDNVVRDNVGLLKGKKKLVRTLLHYMYCNCDIGIKE